MRESAVLFGSTRSLVGIITEPAAEAARPDAPAVLILNSGLVHRVGPKRLHVRLARRLAGLGFTCMRIDLSGIGDSRTTSSIDAISERWLSEVREAMQHLREDHGARHFLVAGNCSGAALSYRVALAEADVVAAALINPQGPNALRYYLRLAFKHPAFWRRLARRDQWHGRIQGARKWLARFGAGAGRAPATARGTVEEVRSLVERGVRLLVVNCEWDAGYDLFQVAHRERLHALGDGRILLDSIPGSDHDFNLRSAQDRLLDIVQRWAASL